MAIVTRTGLGRPLKHSELDNNFVEIVGALNQLDERLDEFSPDTPNGLLDLTNENINIPTDSDGNNPDLDDASTFVNLYINGESLADTVGGYVAGSNDLAITIEQSWQISGELSNCNGNWVEVNDSPINQFEITSISADYASVKFTASNTSYASDLVSFLRLNKVKAAVDGTPATVFSVKASHNAVVLDKEGNFNPSILYFTGYKAIGNNEPSQSDVGFLRIFTDKGIGFSNSSTTPNGITETGYTVQADDEFIRAIFYSGSEVYLDSETIPVITDGNDAIIVRLSNENHSLPTDKDGDTIDDSGCGTEIRVYQGGYELSYDEVGTSDGTYNVTRSLIQGNGDEFTLGNIADSGTYATVADHTITDDVNNVFVVRYTISGKTRDGQSFTATADQTLTKAKQGVDGSPGANAKTVVVTAQQYFFVKKKDGTYSPNSINIAANTQNLTANGSWTSSNANVITYGNFDNSYNNPTGKILKEYFSDGVTVTYSSHGNDGSISDTISFAEVEEGADTIDVILSNSNHNLPAATDGSVFSFDDSGTIIRVFEGANELQFTNSTRSNSEFSVSALASNAHIIDDGSIEINTATSPNKYAQVEDYSVSEGPVLTTKVVTITFTITAKKSNGTEVVVDVTQTLTKSLQGATGPDGPTGPVGETGPVGQTGPDGKPALNIYLTKSNHNVYAYNYNDFIPDAFADANGIITVYAGDTKLIPVYDENTYNTNYFSNANYYLIEQDTNNNVLAANLVQGNSSNRQSTYSVTGFQDKTQSSASLKFNITYLNNPYEAFFNLTKVEAGLKTSTYLSRNENELNDIAFDENNGELLQLKDYVFSGEFDYDNAKRYNINYIYNNPSNESINVLLDEEFPYEFLGFANYQFFHISGITGFYESNLSLSFNNYCAFSGYANNDRKNLVFNDSSFTSNDGQYYGFVAGTAQIITFTGEFYGKVDSNPNLLTQINKKYKNFTGWDSAFGGSGVQSSNYFEQFGEKTDFISGQSGWGLQITDGIDIEINQTYCASFFYKQTSNADPSDDLLFRIQFYTGISNPSLASMGLKVSTNGNTGTTFNNIDNSNIIEYNSGIQNFSGDWKRAWFSIKPKAQGDYELSNIDRLDIIKYTGSYMEVALPKFEKSEYPTDWNDTDNGQLNLINNMFAFSDNRTTNYLSNFQYYDNNYNIATNVNRNSASNFVFTNPVQLTNLNKKSLVFKLKKFDGTPSQYEKIWIPINSVPDPNRVKKISANEIAANSITADKILAGSITAAKMSVTDLSSISANIGTITAGTIKNASNSFRFELNNGLTVLVKGAYAKVSGIGFGASQDLIEWFGPASNITITSDNVDVSACSKTNAQYYIDSEGTSYLGRNTILNNADIIRTALDDGIDADLSAETTAIQTVDSTKTINISFSYNFSLNVNITVTDAQSLTYSINNIRTSFQEKIDVGDFSFNLQLQYNTGSGWINFGSAYTINQNDIIESFQDGPNCAYIDEGVNGTLIMKLNISKTVTEIADNTSNSSSVRYKISGTRSLPQINPSTVFDAQYITQSLSLTVRQIN